MMIKFSMNLSRDGSWAFKAMEVDGIVYQPFEGQVYAVYYHANRAVACMSTVDGLHNLENIWQVDQSWITAFY